jgi:hypothetical protein
MDLVMRVPVCMWWIPPNQNHQIHHPPAIYRYSNTAFFCCILKNIETMKKLSIAFAIAAITAGSAHAVVYSSEDFEGGTPNYTITGAGPYTFTQLSDVNAVPITPDVALTGTDYTQTSASRMGVFANGTVPGVSGEPTGQHAFVSAASSRNLVLRNALTLSTDGIQTLTISFDTMVYGLNEIFTHTASVQYSALGDFTDTVQIATYNTVDYIYPIIPAEPNPNPLISILGNTVVTEDTWTTLNLSISSSQVTFTDTAKIRFTKLPVADNEQMVFFDNITITGVIPEPSTTALCGLAGFALLLRRRK